MKRITVRDVLQLPVRAFLWSDRVLWGKPLGRLVILTVLLSTGVPLQQAGVMAEYGNRALDAITADVSITELAR